MADESKWTPAEVRGLVNDIFKWLVIIAGLWLGVDAKREAAQATAKAESVHRVVMGQP